MFKRAKQILHGIKQGGPWRCFHCGFKTWICEDAADHFGETPCSEPICFYIEGTNVLDLLHENTKVHNQINRLTEIHDDLKYQLNLYDQLFKQYGSPFNIGEKLRELEYALERRDLTIEKIRKINPQLVADTMAEVAGEPQNSHLYLLV